jgi:ADP-glucose pyrophosphorylase
MTVEERNERNERKEKILKGLELAYQNMILFKKEKNSKIVVSQGDKIVHLNP